MKTLYVKMDVLTPVHIGTGEDADPFSYVIHPVSQPNDASLYYVDLVQWIEGSEDPKRLADIFETSRFPFVRKYIHEHLNPKIYGSFAYLQNRITFLTDFQEELIEVTILTSSM